jgi:hypothetical protein
MVPKRIPGPAELRGRGLQQLAAMADRHGLLPWGTPSAGDPSRLRPQLPSPPLTAAAIAAIPVHAICARADLVLAGQYPLLGHGHGAAPPLAWGAAPDWHRDVLSNKVAPRVHFTRVPYLDVHQVGDHKVTWELNRHQWMIWLAQAARCTQDARYTDAIWERLAHWLEHNPRGMGINWASSLEVAFRAMAWSWALHIAPSSPPPALAPALATALHEHGRHVERWLSTWFSPNTHLTGEALALLTLGVAFPWLPRAAHWRTLGWQILCDEALVQLRPDGSYFEQTGWYQAYTVDFYLEAVRLAEHGGLSVPDGVRARTHAAARALAAMTRGDGTVVRWGDDDGGRLLPLTTGAYGDVRDTLALAAVAYADASLLVGHAHLAQSPANAAVAWHHGESGLRTLEALVREAAHSAPLSVYLGDGGWAALRGSAVAAYLDAGPHAALSGAHAHADALSLEVTVHGRAVLADPGTYQYMGAGRDRFRATAAHNALTVGEASSATPAGPFRWARVPITTVTGVTMQGDTPLVQAWHDGFAALAAEGTGRTWRELRLMGSDALLVLDWFEGRPTQPLGIHWRPPAGVRAVPEPGRILLVDETLASDRAPVLATIVIPSQWRADATVQGYSPGYAVCIDVTGVTCRPVHDTVHACCALVVAGLAPADTTVTWADAAPDAQLAHGAASPAWRVQHNGRVQFVTPTSFS